MLVPPAEPQRSPLVRYFAPGRANEHPAPASAQAARRWSSRLVATASEKLPLSRSPPWRTLTVSELRFHSVNSDRLEGGSQNGRLWNFVRSLRLRAREL